MITYKQWMKKRTGTSFKGYALVTYKNLVALFGLPLTYANDDKIDAEWIINTPYGVATIYNYKDGTAYLGADGLAVEQICEWHVGGKTAEPYHWVKKKYRTNRFSS